MQNYLKTLKTKPKLNKTKPNKQRKPTKNYTKNANIKIPHT